MANSIELAKKFVPIIDEIYRKTSLTSILDAKTQLDFTNTNEVKVMKVDTTGLGDYSRQNGYPEGDVSVTWETMKLNEDRGKQLTVDRMDDDETLYQAFGAAMRQFMERHVVREVDAYRFAKYAKIADVGKTAAMLDDGETVIKALRAATTAMDEAEVPTENRILFITPTQKGLVDDLDTTKSKEVLKRYSTIIEVPQTRFYDDITLNSGEGAWGFTKGADAKDINFIAVANDAVVQATKMALPKIFDPDTNQKSDSWLFQYRLYHDCFAYENKVKGIYVHTKA